MSLLRGVLVIAVLGGIWTCVAFDLIWPMPIIVVAGLMADSWLNSRELSSPLRARRCSDGAMPVHFKGRSE